MSQQLLDLNVVTDAEIIARCLASGLRLLSDSSCSNKVVQISPDIVVKFGRYVKRGEFLNQNVAFQLLDPAIVRVPMPHRFIQHENTGYLVMQYAIGEVPSPEMALALAPQLGRIFSHLHEIHSEIPGSLGGDAIQGAIWPRDDITFKDRSNLEEWLNLCLKRQGHSINLEGQQLVLCHMDFVPRNMVVHDGVVTLLDWAAAGYFPQIFDYIAHQFSPFDIEFFEGLQPHLQKLTDQEEEVANDVLRVFDNCQIYRL
jgi:aminoglycoside phosphotransferase (APT) family kinase protein